MKKSVINLFGVLAFVALRTVSVQAASETWSGSVNSTWDNTTANWTGSTTFTNGNDALFTGTPVNNVTTATGLTIGAITLDSTFTGSVALTGGNTVNGATTISAGMLTLTNSATAAGASAITVNSPGTLALNASTTADMTYANTVAGAGKVQFLYNATGGHDIYLDNLGSFTGTIELSLASGSASTGGKARLYAATLSGASSLIIDSGTQLYMGGGNVTLAGIQVQGTGNTETRGAIRFQTGTLTSPISLMGNTTFGTEGATLPSGSPISAGSSGLKTLTLGGASDTSGGSLTINSIISDGGGQVALNQLNTGTLTLSGANTYSGGTTISAGTLQVGSGGSLGSGNVTNNSTLTFNLSGNLTVSENIVNTTGGAGGVNQQGAGALTLSGANALGNFLNVTAGTLTNAGTTTVNGGSANNTGYMNVSGNTTVTIPAGGSLSILGTLYATVPNSIVGQNAAGTSTLTANGGSLTIGGNTGFALGNNVSTAIGVLTITNNGMATISAGSATLQNVQNFIAMGRDNATGIINLAPGTLATGRQFVRDGSSGGTVGAGTATFNFNGGTLKALASQTAGNGWFETATTGNFQVVTTTIMGGGATIDANGFNVDINTVLAHGGVSSTDGGLTLINSTGTGILTLGGVSTYTGPTIVNGGILKITGTVPTATTVNPGGAIGASSGTFGALVTLTAGNSAINLVDNAATTTTFGNGLTLNNGNVLTFELGASSDQISVGGTFTHNGTATMNLVGISGFSATTYTLITDAANDITSTNGFVVGTVPSGFSAVLGASGGALTVTLTQNAPNVAYWKGGLGNAWNTVSGGNANWTSDAGGTVNTVVPPGSPTAVIFAATGAANFNTVLGGNFEINSLTLSTATNVTIGGATNSLSILSGLTNASAALNNTINASNVTLAASQTWENDSTNALTVSSLINDAGGSALTTAGAGPIILTSTNNSYSGGTTISAGTLQLGDGAVNDGSVAGAVTNDSELLIADPVAQTFSGAISGTGVLGKSGGGVLTLPGANTYTGGTIINSGTLQVNNNSALGGTAEFAGTGTVTNNGILSLNIGNNWFYYPITGGGSINVTETTNAESRFDGNMTNFTGVINVPASLGSSKVDIEGGAVNWSPAATINVANGGTLFVESASETLGAWSGQPTMVAATIHVSGSGNSEGYGALRVDDAAVLTGNVILQGNTVYGGAYTSAHGISGISGVISDGGLGYGISCANTISGQAEEFWGANTYSGVTTWTNAAYTLVLGNGSALQNSTLNLGPGNLLFDSAVSSNAFVFGGLAGSSSITLTNGNSAVALTVGNNNSTTVYNGNLSDAGMGASLTKIGTGTLTLGGVNTYSGATTVSGGQLVLNTFQTNATAGIAVNDGATLTLDVAGTNQLTSSAYTLGSSAGPVTNGFVGLTSTTVAPVNTTSLTLNGRTTVNIIGGSFAVGLSYPLISFSSIGGSGGFIPGELPRGLAGTIVTNSGNTIALLVTAYVPTTDLWTGSVNTNWNITGTSNWLVNGVANTYLDGDNTRFDDTAVSTNVFVTTVVSPSSMVVSNNAKTYTISGSAINGVGGLIKQGSGLLLLSGTNTYLGNTLISSGTVQLGGFNVLPGGSGKGDVTLNGTLDLNSMNETINGLSGTGTVDTVSGGAPVLTIGASGSSSTFNGVIQNSAGTLTVTKNGSGILTLGGSNTYSGVTTVSGGTLKLANPNALGSTVVSTIVATNATLDLNGQAIAQNLTLNSGAYLFNTSPSAAAISGNITAANSSFTVIGGTGNITFATITSGGVQFDVTNLNTGTIDLAGTADNGFLNMHVAAGTVILDKTGAVGQRATSALFVEGGLAQLGGTTGDQIFDGNPLTVNSGTFDMNGRTETVGNLNGSGGVILNNAASTTGTLTIGGLNANNGDYQGVIENGTGTTALTKTGTGSEYLEGVNTYTGSTLINGGTLYLANSGSINNSTLISIASGATLDVATVGSGTLTLNSGQTLAGAGSVNGNVTSLAGSTINPGGGVAVSTLTVSSATLGGVLLMDLDRTNTPSNCDQLAGSITYGGTLAVTNIGQTLQVGDKFQLFPSAVTSFSGISLPATDATGYHYTWTNNVAVDGSISVATVSAEASSANDYLLSLVLSNNLSAAVSLTPVFTTNGYVYYATNTLPASQVNVTVTDADLTATNTLFVNGASYGLLPSGITSATLALTAGSNNVTVQVVSQSLANTNNYTVNVFDLPSLTSPKLTNSVSGSTLSLGWDTNHLGYRLLMQTNNLGRGISTNAADWGTVAGSTVITSTNITIPKTSPTNGFYRLVYP